MEILDCTLRDGGYYTNWDFDFKLVDEYLNAVSELPIKIIEPGYISNAYDNKGPFYHLNKKILSIFKKKINKNQKIFVMINLKEIKNFRDIDNLVSQNINFIDGIRFAIDPKDLKKYLPIIIKLKKKFTKIEYCFNLMYASTWINDLRNVKKIINESRKAADNISLIDSYGAITPLEMIDFFTKVKKLRINFDGVHFHNNCNFALANTIISISNGVKRVDSTFTGMGRGSGNAETEYLLAYLKVNVKNTFNLSNLIDNLNTMKKKLEWGPSYAYAFSAMRGFSQAKMMNLIQNRRLDQGLATNLIKQFDLKKNEINITTDTNLSFKEIKKKIKSQVFIFGGGQSCLDKGPIFIKNLKKTDLIIVLSNRTLEHLIKVYESFHFENEIVLILTGNEINKLNLKNRLIKKLKIRNIILEKNFFNKKLSFFKDKKIFHSNSVAENPLLIAGIFLKKVRYFKLNLAFFEGGQGLEAGMNETLDSINFLKKIGMEVFSYTKTYIPSKTKNPWVND